MMVLENMLPRFYHKAFACYKVREIQMNLNEVSVAEEVISLDAVRSRRSFRYEYTYGGTSSGHSQPDSCNRVIGTFDIDELIEKTLQCDAEKSLCHENDFFFYASGWQSWGFGGELCPGEHQKRYLPIVPQWKQYIAFPGAAPAKVLGRNPSSRSLLKGQFVIYFRWNNIYIVIASTGSRNPDFELMPPVQFYVDRKKRQAAVSVYADGKQWNLYDKMCELTVFAAASFFELRDTMKELFAGSDGSRFENLQFLSGSGRKILTGGWESWYNHYANINRKLIDEDLESLGRTDNIVNTEFIKNSRPAVFQVDDGWEKGLGDWEALQERFPEGMKNLASSISSKGYIPGLWIAPFIVDLRSDIAKVHGDWILRDEKGRPVAAGMNFLWGARAGKYQPSYPWSYFCLDLSRDEVMEHLDNLMDKVINAWGFRYIKLDFLFAGMISGVFANDGAAYEWYNRAVQVLTKRAVNNKGESVAYLGCGLPLESSYVYLPLSRIGPDTREDWDVNYLRHCNFTARTGALPNLQSTLGHSFWDQGVFINDPDVIFLRYDNIRLNDTEKELIALVNNLFASQLMHSDDPVIFGETEKEFTQHVSGLFRKFEDEEFGLVNVSRTTYIIYSRSGRYCGFINLGEKPFTVTKKQVLAYAGLSAEDGTEWKNVVEHFVESDDTFTAEKHSVSVFELVKAGAQSDEEVLLVGEGEISAEAAESEEGAE